MKSPIQQRKIILVGISLFIFLAGLGGVFAILQARNSENPAINPNASIATATLTARRPVAPLASATPGVVIYGTVRDQNGIGLENVLIYRNYASYPALVIATTDASGYYESNFYPIPGDEMVGLWAEKPGFVFKPLNYNWRHYYSYEQAQRDFLASQP